MTDLILYTTENGRTQIKLRTDQLTVWLSQRGIAQLLDGSMDNLGQHLNIIIEDGELIPRATAEGSSVVQMEGWREVTPILHNDSRVSSSFLGKGGRPQ